MCDENLKKIDTRQLETNDCCHIVDPIQTDKWMEGYHIACTQAKKAFCRVCGDHNRCLRDFEGDEKACGGGVSVCKKLEEFITELYKL